METIIGKVKEVFLPKQYKHGNLLDVMDRTSIGFKIKTKNGIKKYILKSNEVNAKIFKDDMVLIRKQTVYGKRFIDIELYEGDLYV